MKRILKFWYGFWATWHGDKFTKYYEGHELDSYPRIVEQGKYHCGRKEFYEKKLETINSREEAEGYIRKFSSAVAIAITLIISLYIAFFISICQIKDIQEDVKNLSNQMEQTLKQNSEEEKNGQDALNGIKKQVRELKTKLDKQDEILSRGADRSMMMDCTAYTESTCGKSPDNPAYGITFSGEKVREWYTIAAGPELEIGTKIYIPFFKDKPNGGYFVVTDRGGKWIQNGELDIYLSSYDACIEFGRRDLEVYIIG